MKPLPDSAGNSRRDWLRQLQQESEQPQSDFDNSSAFGLASNPAGVASDSPVIGQQVAALPIFDQQTASYQRFHGRRIADEVPTLSRFDPHGRSGEDRLVKTGIGQNPMLLAGQHRLHAFAPKVSAAEPRCRRHEKDSATAADPEKSLAFRLTFLVAVFVIGINVFAPPSVPLPAPSGHVHATT